MISWPSRRSCDVSDLELPFPIVFGDDFPKLRLRLVRGKQYAYSISNLNLYISDQQLTANGTYPISQLFNPWDATTPDFARDEQLVLPLCESETPEPCPMLLEKWTHRDYRKDTSEKEALRIHTVELRETARPDKCRVIKALLDPLQSSAQRRLAEVYYAAAFTPSFWDGTEQRYKRDLRRSLGAFLAQWHKAQMYLGRFGTPAGLCSVILEAIRVPALIPEVWLNHVFDPTRHPDEERIALKGAPKRVDFIFIQGGKLHVVEVDGPSHYATYDSASRKYEVDEKLYTDNLRVERNLRGQGIEIHRLSNWEILNSTHDQLVQLIREVLGIQMPFDQRNSLRRMRDKLNAVVRGARKTRQG